jgi:putative ABC transport system permease protein
MMIRLILREIFFRKGHAMLMLTGLVSVTALTTSYLTTEDAAARETRRITRDLGFNLRILPRETDMDTYWFQGFSDQTMSEETVEKLASFDGVFMTYNHLMASLKQKILLGGKEVVVVGVAPTVTSLDKKKRPMGFSIDPGTLHMGHQVGKRLNLKGGDSLTVAGREFKVARVMVEYGTEEDVYVYGTLTDIQAITDTPGRINEIKAIDCLCLTADQDPVSILRNELQKALPEAKVIQDRVQADARARQRQMVQKKFEFLSPFLMCAGAVWVAVLSMLNVRERRSEIGIWRALGKRGGMIGGMFIGKAVLLGLVGGGIGFWVGNLLALEVGPDIFQVTAKAIRTEWNYFFWAVGLTPALAAAAAFMPAMMAVSQDPANTLRES